MLSSRSEVPSLSWGSVVGRPFESGTREETWLPENCVKTESLLTRQRTKEGCVLRDKDAALKPAYFQATFTIIAKDLLFEK